ncbi:MAG: hypothetical protein NTZ83_02245 [Candidatus Pacearchaeota archaeon]|nr:hypothetical protein [Candidatus Pacearchaeota archaeon]
MNDNTLVLSAISTIFVGAITVIGYFINLWMTKTSNLISEASVAIAILNVTLTKVNLTMEVYQATVNEELKSVREKVAVQDKLLNQHGTDIQDHEIRISINETKCEAKHPPKLAKR